MKASHLGFSHRAENDFFPVLLSAKCILLGIRLHFYRRYEYSRTLVSPLAKAAYSIPPQSRWRRRDLYSWFKLQVLIMSLKQLTVIWGQYMLRYMWDHVRLTVCEARVESSYVTHNTALLLIINNGGPLEQWINLLNKFFSPKLKTGFSKLIN